MSEVCSGEQTFAQLRTGLRQSYHLTWLGCHNKKMVIRVQNITFVIIVRPIQQCNATLLPKMRHSVRLPSRLDITVMVDWA